MLLRAFGHLKGENAFQGNISLITYMVLLGILVVYKVVTNLETIRFAVLYNSKCISSSKIDWFSHAMHVFI
jgi:hypothetical protein